MLRTNELAAEALIHPGQKLRIPSGARGPAQLDLALRTYVVQPGDSVSDIAARHGVDVWAMLRTNGLTADALIHPGQELRIPLVPGGSLSSPEIIPGNATRQFGWPVQGWISTHFLSGHPGLDIAADHGVPIYAADGGVVRSAGWNDGYGNQVVIDHRNGYVTTYGHLSSFSVWPGQLVAKGAIIGRNGSTGRSTGPHLHFEVIRNGYYVNPLDFLPKRLLLASGPRHILSMVTHGDTRRGCYRAGVSALAPIWLRSHASMKASRSPSSTACALLVSTFVRRSLTML